MNTIPIDVFILCGGLGTRLKSVTGINPKSLAKIGERPFLDILISYLYRLGFRRFILGVGYKAELIKNHYQNKEFGNIEIVLSEEHKPLGTGGAVKNAFPLFNSENTLVLNGDSFSDFKPTPLLELHNTRKATATMLIRKAEGSSDYGVIEIDDNFRVVKYAEKVKPENSTFINSGVYIFNKSVFSMMPDQEAFSLERDLFPALVRGGSMFGLEHTGIFIDIGTPDRYSQATEKLSGYI